MQRTFCDQCNTEITLAQSVIRRTTLVRPESKYKFEFTIDHNVNANPGGTDSGRCGPELCVSCKLDLLKNEVVSAIEYIKEIDKPLNSKLHTGGTNLSDLNITGVNAEVGRP